MKLSPATVGFAFLALAMILPVRGGETALFTSGMRMQIDRHEEAGAMVRLYRGGAVLEMPRVALVRFEPDEASPAPAPAASAEATAPPKAAPALPPSDPLRSPDKKAPIDTKAAVREAATRSGLPPAFVESVAKTESGFDPHAISSKGAIGVMQLMPATAKSLGADPTDPAQNIEAGAKLLRDLLLKYDGDVVKALAAYNAGEAAVERYQGVPPYPETQHYVNTVVREYLNQSSDQPTPKGAGQ